MVLGSFPYPDPAGGATACAGFLRPNETGLPVVAPSPDRGGADRRPRSSLYADRVDHGDLRTQDASIFDRYNIVSEDDLAAAMERTHAYVEQARKDEPRVRPLEARAQNAHTRVDNAENEQERAAVSA